MPSGTACPFDSDNRMADIDTFFACIASVQGDPGVVALALSTGLLGGNARHTFIAALLAGYVRYTFSSVTAAPDSQYYLWAYVSHIVVLSLATLAARHLLRRALTANRPGHAPR